MRPAARPAIDEDAIQRVVDGYGGVDAVYLFGSHARGTAHRDSDMDLGVLLARDAFPTAADRFNARVRLTADLIGALHTNDIDVIVLNDAPPLLARAVIRTGRRLLCRNEEADTAFRRQVQLRAADLEPSIQRMRRTMLKAARA